MRAFLVRTVIAIALASCVVPVSAQRATGPYSGVLGAAADGEARQTLDVRGSLFGAWDDTLTSSDASAVDQRFLRSGAASGASGSLTHALRSSNLQWSSSASSSLRLYGSKSEDRAATYAASTSLNTRIARRISLTASGGWAYSPYYSFAPGYDRRLATEGAFGGGFGLATAAEKNTMANAGTGLTWQLSRRDAFSVTGSASRYNFPDEANGSIDTWGGSARFTHTLSRSLSFHAGFGRTQARYKEVDNRSATSDSIDVGVDYNDALVFSGRRTSLAFGWSTGAVRWNDDTMIRLNGTATLTRGFGRSGSAALRYSRTTNFDAGFREPILSDTVSAGVNDQLGRRVTWSTQVSYSHNGIGFSSSSQNYDAYNAGGGITVALTRRIGLYTDYSFYSYEMPAGATVFTSLPEFSRQSVTAGLTLWAPLIADKRSSRDSR